MLQQPCFPVSRIAKRTSSIPTFVFFFLPLFSPSLSSVSCAFASQLSQTSYPLSTYTRTRQTAHFPSMLFGSLQQSSVEVAIHPQTTHIVLREGAEPANLLVGYVSVVAKRQVTINRLTVRLYGEQQVSWREGDGPSSALYSAVNCCADIQHTLVDTSTATASDIEVAKVKSQLHLARSHMRAADATMAKPALVIRCVTANAKSSSKQLQQPQERPRRSVEEENNAAAVSHSLPLTLAPGEYRFAFEFALASNLPPSVHSSLGHVAYRLSATLRRPWFQSTTTPGTLINILQCPSPSPSRPSALLGYPTLQALASAPLLMQAPVGDSWKISVYSASRALSLGWPMRLQVCASRAETPDGRGAGRTESLELVEFAVSLNEIITHKTPYGATKTTRNTVAESAICPLEIKKAKPTLHHQSIDPHMIDALGDSLDELPNARSLVLPLPPKGKHRVQASSASLLFSVTHKLRVVVSVRGLAGSRVPHRVAFNVPVVVLPEALCERGMVKSLPCYRDIARDIILISSDPTALCRSAGDSSATAQASLPSYSSLYM
ncbi:hypothetical protein GQ54DRAFT_33013 [Martensiomyces pterosporus]|nr:hypothetical protein GQ54DRAFT_33013 [Martensiomyces pterosporus]